MAKQPVSKRPNVTKVNVKGEWPGSFGLINEAIVRLNFSKRFMFLYVGISTLLALISYALNPQPLSFKLAEPASHNDFYWPLTLLSLAVSLFFMAPLYAYYLGVSEAKEQTSREIIKKGLRRLPALLGYWVLSALAIVIGCIAFILPGMYIAYRLILGFYVVVDKELSPLAAFKESYALTGHNPKQVLGYLALVILTILPVSVLSLAQPVVGTLLSSVVTLVAGIIGAWLYRWMQAHQRRA